MDESDLVRFIEEGSRAFDEMCDARHAKGQKEYGTFTFLDKNVAEMAMEEIADANNYLRYLFIKLYLLNHVLGEKYGDKEIPIGPEAFTATGDREEK